MSEKSDDILFLLADLNSEDVNTRWQALNRAKAEKVIDEEVLTEIEKIADDDPSDNLKQIASNVLADLRGWQKGGGTDRQILERTLLLVEKQQSQINEIKRQTGCVYNFVVLLVILMVILIFSSFIGFL